MLLGSLWTEWDQTVVRPVAGHSELWSSLPGLGRSSSVGRGDFLGHFRDRTDQSWLPLAVRLVGKEKRCQRWPRGPERPRCSPSERPLITLALPFVSDSLETFLWPSCQVLQTRIHAFLCAHWWPQQRDRPSLFFLHGRSLLPPQGPPTAPCSPYPWDLSLKLF